MIQLKENLACVKDKGSNLRSDDHRTLKCVVNCDNLRLEEPFQGPCFGHAMSKACQYATTNEKVFIGLHKMSIKSTQTYFLKCITWPKKSKEGHQIWTKVYDVRWWPRKLNMHVKQGDASSFLFVSGNSFLNDLLVRLEVDRACVFKMVNYPFFFLLQRKKIGI